MGQAGGEKGHGLWIDQVCAQFRLFCAAAMVIRDCSRSNNVKQIVNELHQDGCKFGSIELTV